MLDVPLGWHVLAELRQLLGLWIDAGDGDLGPIRQFQITLLELSKEALTVAEDGMEELV